LNAREREQYLREYSILKNQGKPFLYSIAKDSVMACITLGVIILMAVLFGAELGPKADPTTTIAAMAYLTVLGALAGAPSEIELATAPQFERGKEVTASAGCLACHKIGENGGTLGPSLTHIGDRLGRDAIARTLVNPTPPMPSYRSYRAQSPKQFNELVNYVASLKGEN
jgi:mono/diheme cytochrome c family protein